jgi:hypothetical protein
VKRLGLIATAVLTLAGTLGAEPDRHPPPDLPHVRADGRHLTFAWHGGAPHRVDISSLIHASILDTVKALAARRQGDIDYFVVSVSGPSQLFVASNAGPAGTEANLIWLKLQGWKLLDTQSVLYQSSREYLEPVGDSYVKGGVLTVRYRNDRENMEYALRFDLEKPENRIDVEKADGEK